MAEAQQAYTHITQPTNRERRAGGERDGEEASEQLQRMSDERDSASRNGRTQPANSFNGLTDYSFSDEQVTREMASW